MQTLTDSVLKSNMPLFDGTAASAGLLKPQAMSGFLGKRTLQYNGTYFTYDPRGKDGVGFAPPWSNSKTSPLGDRSPVSQLTGKERQNHMAYRQDSASSEEGHSHSSSLHHPPANQGFTFYSKTSSPTVATSVAVRKPKIGAETPSSPSQSSLYLAIPKPVYGHNPCCNELGCMIGQRYSVDHVSQRIPNTVYEHDWLQTPAHYTEKQSVQRKEALLQQRGLQLERGAEQLKKMSIEAYSPSRVRTLPSVIEPNYSSYPCAPTRTLFGSLSEHSQCLQTSPTGYPSLYTSHPTYEQMTSELYQERSPMSKYGQLTQHPVFYYSQANGEAENSPQCKDSGSKQGEDVSLLHKHIIPKPLEHYVVPQSLHAEIPLSCAEMLPNPSFMRGFEYPYYAVPRFHLNASQIRGPLERQHSSPAFYTGHINVSPSSQQIDLSVAKDKPKTSLHVDQQHSSSPFLRLDQSTPTRCVNQPAISPSSIQMGRGFRPLASLHRDAPIFPGADMNADRLRDFSTCRTQAKQPKILPVSHAAWQPQSSSHSSQRVHTAVPSGKNARKIVHSPAVMTGRKHNGFALNTGTTAKNRCLKRSISHSSPSIKIEEEDKDVYEVELSSKQQKVEMEHVKKGNKTDSPPMPVIDNVFSLAPCQLHLQSSGVLFPGRVPERATHEDKSEQNIKENGSGQADRQPPVSPVSKETSPDTQVQEAEVEVLKPKDIKVEKEDASDMGNCVESQNEYRKVIVKTEPRDTGSLGSEPMLLKKKCESDELERKPPTPAEKEVSDNCNCTELTAQINSSSPSDALHKQAIILQPKSIHPLQLPESKVHFKNIPPHYLKLSTYRIIIPDGKQCNTVPPSEKPSPQPVTSPSSKQELETPVRKHFFELHHSLCKLVSKSVSASTEQDLKDWLSPLEITAPASKSTKVEKLSCLLGVKAREVWINEEMKSALHKVLERLKEYTSQERCPFPHVMRTGAVFLPMLVVKELLFPMVQGSFIDQVLQEHKVELRPTTLSEEKILIQLHKRACSSRLRRLMSLKHLPDIYTDVVNLLYYTSVCKHLGKSMFTLEMLRCITAHVHLVQEMNDACVRVDVSKVEHSSAFDGGLGHAAAHTTHNSFQRQMTPLHAKTVEMDADTAVCVCVCGCAVSGSKH